MALLQPITDAPGYLKATFQGPQGAGKTYTAALVAARLHDLIGSKRPVAFFDTEGGSDFVAALLKERTKQTPLRVKTRAFRDLMEAGAECVKGAADILLVDSITHVWRELQDAYMRRQNEGRDRPRTRMELDDIMAIKEAWRVWPDFYVTSNLHIIVCGREGAEWGHEYDEERGKSSLVQTGRKMKVETEFGFEGNLNVAFSTRQEGGQRVKKKGGKRETVKRTVVNIATVLKDRTDTMNGAVIEMPKGEDFDPHIKRLNPAAHRAVDTNVKSQDGIANTTDDGWGRERRDREILTEEIQGELTSRFPGADQGAKFAKGQLLMHCFQTRSWTKVGTMESGALRAGLKTLRETIKDEAKLREIVTIPGAEE